MIPSPYPSSPILPSAGNRAPKTLVAGKIPAFALILLCITLLEGVQYSTISLWVPIGLILTAFVLILVVSSAATRVPLMQILMLNTCVHFIVSSLILYYLPPFSIYDIGHVRYPEYVSYVVPAAMAMCGGLLLGSAGARSQPFSEEAIQRDIPAFAHYARSFILIGVLAGFSNTITGERFGFAMFLVAHLRWVGVITLFILGTRDRWIFCTLVLFIDLTWSSQSTLFGDLILWSGGLFLTLCYRNHWQIRAAILLVVAFLGMMIIQDVKFSYRAAVSTGQTGSAAHFVSMLLEDIKDPKILTSPQQVSYNLVRFNQGWIVDKVMRWVPEHAPYAGGSTIEEDILDALLPRIVNSNKQQAGGNDLFNHYTGRSLSGDTHMAVSPVGEMYLNYGAFGGAIGMLVFGLILGRLYRWLTRLAQKNPLWWAWGPYVGLWAMKADEDVVNIANWVVKSLMFAIVVVYVCKRIRRVPDSNAGNRDRLLMRARPEPLGPQASGPRSRFVG